MTEINNDEFDSEMQKKVTVLKVHTCLWLFILTPLPQISATSKNISWYFKHVMWDFLKPLREAQLACLEELPNDSFSSYCAPKFSTMTLS